MPAPKKTVELEHARRSPAGAPPNPRVDPTKRQRAFQRIAREHGQDSLKAEVFARDHLGEEGQRLITEMKRRRQDNWNRAVGK